jgi:hypothetical protein
VPPILKSLPYSPGPLLLKGKLWRIALENQIFVRISITQPGIPIEEFDGRTPVFWALLDTGCNTNLSIRDEDLTNLARLTRSQLPTRASQGREINGIPVAVRDADVWIYKNKPGTPDLMPDVLPVPLRLNEGINIYPPESVRPDRPPLLGLGAIQAAGLRLCIDGAEQRLSLRTARRFWLFD